MASVLPPLSRKSLILPALLFAVPLALAQGVTIFFFGRIILTPPFPWLLGMLPWLLSMPVGFVLVGGLCSFRTTSNVPDETISANRGRFSGLLTGFFSSLLGLFALVLLVVWYTNWWIPTLSPQPPSPCLDYRGGPFGCMSPQEGARFGLLALPIVILAFLLGNTFFVFFAMQSGTLVGRLRARRELNMRRKEEQSRSPARPS
jgi:hypothetical protein